MDILSRLASESKYQFDDILDLVAAQSHKKPWILFALSCVNKTLHSALSPESPAWAIAWKAVSDSKKSIDVQWAPKSPKTCLKLYGFSGCMMCGRSRIRKVWPQYELRACSECVIENSLSGYRFETEYDVKPSSLGIPSHEGTSFNKYCGRVEFTCYMIDRVLKATGASSLAELSKRACERREAKRDAEWLEKPPNRRRAIRRRTLRSSLLVRDQILTKEMLDVSKEFVVLVDGISKHPDAEDLSGVIQSIKAEPRVKEMILELEREEACKRFVQKIFNRVVSKAEAQEMKHVAFLKAVRGERRLRKRMRWMAQMSQDDRRSLALGTKHIGKRDLDAHVQCPLCSQFSGTICSLSDHCMNKHTRSTPPPKKRK